jgi:hypothetical protein
VALVHGITAGGVSNVELGAGMGEFINRYIFPGGELLHVSRVLHDMAGSGLEMVDTENLRPHYARTLWAWSDALEAQLGRRPRSCSSRLRRACGQGAACLPPVSGRLAMGFEHGWIALHQMLCSQPDGDLRSGAMRVRRAAILSTANTSTDKGASTMAYKFKSRATADLIMLDANGRRAAGHRQDPDEPASSPWSRFRRHCRAGGGGGGRRRAPQGGGRGKTATPGR